METKICSKCGCEKEHGEFYKDRSKKDGLQRICRQCCGEYYKSNKEHILIKNKKYRAEHKEEIGLQKKKYREKNKSKIVKSKKIYSEKNREKISSYKKNWYIRNFDRIAKQKNEKYLRNKEYIKEYNKKYRELNRDKINEQRRVYRKNNKESISKRDSEYKKSIARYETYKDQLTAEESPMCGENGELLCMCTHCHRYFEVTNREAHNRAQAVKGNVERGEQRLYCCQEHKDACDIYNSKLLRKSQREEAAKARCQQQTNRRALLQLQLDEFGYNFCEKCGKSETSDGIDIHHNLMVSKYISEADNMAHQILVCEKCHTHEGC